MQLVARGLVFDAAEKAPEERVAFFTSLCRLQNGTWLCGFTVGEKKHAVHGTIRIAGSADGRHWEEFRFSFQTVINGTPGSLCGSEMLEVVPGRLLLFATWFDRSEPDRPMIDPDTEGIWHAKLLVAESRDDGRTWSDWQEIHTPGLTGCALTGPPVQWSDGTIGLAYESFKHFDDPAPARHAAWLAISRDGGLNFDERVCVAQDSEHKVYFWDQRLCTTSTPGEFVAMFWTHDRVQQRDLNVHFLSANVKSAEITAGVADCSSSDISVKRVLRSPVSVSISGQIAAPLFLADGRVLAFVVDRDRPGTMTLWLSADGGQSWRRDDALVVHVHEELAAVSQGKDHIDFNQYWDDMQKWSFGHPAVRLMDDRHVLMVFYAGLPNRMSIHWALVELESL